MNNSKIKPIIIVVTVFFTMLMMYSICGAIEGVTPSVETPSDNSVDAVTSATERAIKLQIGNPKMTVDGISKEVDPGRGTVPIIKDDRTLLLVRAVIEAVGGTVNWDQTTGDISLSYGDVKIILRIDSTDA